jgi:hypothetical protein
MLKDCDVPADKMQARKCFMRPECEFEYLLPERDLKAL